MVGLLYPAYQKFYSAISCLERFEKEQNFFDNISSLDNFFAEYRNITFAIQAALKHTDFFLFYEKYRDQYLTDRWFVEKRNETTKQKPFQLVKKIDVTIYFPNDSIALFTKSFTVEDDVPMDSLNNDLREFFVTVPTNEVFFSASFSFFEKETTIDLWEKLVAGISSMQAFMDALYNEIGEDCSLCNQLREKIRKSKFSVLPRDFLLVNDYVYYLEEDTFERGSRFAMILARNGNKVATKIPLKTLTEEQHFNYDGTAFGTFVLMHALIRTMRPASDIMPAMLIIYGDDTYDLDVFHADIKTTVYRKISEVSQRIEQEDIRQICFMSLYLYIDDVHNVPETSKERAAIACKDILVFVSVDQELNEMEYVFEGELLSKVEYVACVMQHGRKNKLEIGRLNMSPIIRAFKTKNVSK